MSLSRGYIHVLNHEKIVQNQTSKTLFLNLQQMNEMTSISVDIKTLSPGGCLPLPRGYIHVLSPEKKCIKSDFKEISLKLATHDRSDKMFLLKSKFHPQGVVSPSPRESPGGCLPLSRGYIHVLSPEKKCIKSDFKEISLKLATKDRSDKRFLLKSKFHPQGVVSPSPRESPGGCLPLSRGYIHALSPEKKNA